MHRKGACPVREGVVRNVPAKATHWPPTSPSYQRTGRHPCSFPMGTFFCSLSVVHLQRRGKNVKTCEDDLISSAAQGDPEAFRQLWDAHHAVAMAAALRLCHHRALAEDITQGAFLLAWKGLPRFQRGSPFRPWLMRILYRHALDVMERQRAHPISLDEAIELESQYSSHSHTDLQEQVAQREEIRQAMARLNSEQRRVIALRY